MITRVVAAFMSGWAYAVATAMAQPTIQILIFGGSNHTTFLGCLNCPATDPASVNNDFGTHGWANQFGTWSAFGQFASQFGTNSACNEFASEPPVLVDRAGIAYGRLTINQFKASSVCSAVGAEQVCRALKAMCGTR